MRLTAKLILIVFLAVAALLCAIGMVSIHRQLAGFQQGREELARELKQKNAASLMTAWKDRGRTGVQEAISGMQVEFSRTQIRWVQFEVATDHPDCPSAPRHMLRHVAQGEVESVVMRDGSGNDWLHTYLPLTTDDAPAGVEISDSLASLTNQQRQIIRSTLLTLAGLGVVCLGVVLIAGIRMVGRPLEKLMAKTKEIGQGDFSQPLAISGKDELSQLGLALNELSGQLSAQKEIIEAETASRLAALSELRHADRLKTVGRLAAGIAHELGTPLNVVAGRAGLIAGGKLTEEEMRESASTIKGEADRITRIIRQLLDFARRTTLQRKATELRAVVSRTADLLTTLADSNSVHIELQTNAEPVIANVDEAQIQQVLTNIVMNAIQSISDRGTVTLSLGTRMAVDPDQPEANPASFIFIDVKDTGTGISSEDRDQLFEPFFTTKDVGVGTGLGLSIAYGIVHEHGGWIDVKSELKHGSCFTIYLPKETK